MRIGIISSMLSQPGLGGYVDHLAATLSARSHRVVVLTRAQAVDSNGPKNGYRVVRVPFIPLPPFHLVIHRHFLTRALDRLAPFDVLNVHTPLCPPPGSSLPVVTTVHTPLAADIRQEEETDLRSLIGRALVRGISVPNERRLLARSTGILATSTGVARDLDAYGVDPSSVEVVGNAVDTEEFAPSSATNRLESEILYVGRLGTRKGLGHLLQAFRAVLREVPKATLRIVGGGPLRRRMEGLARNLGIDGHVRFEGFIGKPELVRAYRRAAVFVLPSSYEGLATSLLEAMASETPVVATRVPGSEDVVRDESNGLLVPPKAPSELAQGIVALLLDRDRAVALGREGRRTVERGYTWDHVARRHERTFEAVVG